MHIVGQDGTNTKFFEAKGWAMRLQILSQFPVRVFVFQSVVAILRTRSVVGVNKMRYLLIRNTM